MTRPRRKKASATDGLPPNKANAEVHAIEGKSAGYALVKSEHDPAIRHAMVCGLATRGFFPANSPRPGMGDRADALSDHATQIGGGDLDGIGKMLAAQALTCDAMFTNLMLRAQTNLAQYPEAAKSYMALALKAQAQSRASLEAIAKMRQPREQVVRHVHVYEGGQAIVADQFNHYGGGRFVGTGNQPHALGPAMLGTHPQGFGVPIPSDAERAVSASRWEVHGSAEGEPQRVEARHGLGGDESPPQAAARDAA